jgi:hypothetical protein
VALSVHPNTRLVAEPDRDLLLDPLRRLLRHGIFTGEDDLPQQMLAFIETHNQTAKPFAWTYTGETPERMRTRIYSSHH